MLVAYTDGLCEPRNPGGTACCGWVVYRDNRKLAEGHARVCSGPQATNNVAEYSAVIAVLEWLLANGFADERIEVRSDSQLCVYQLTGRYSVNSERIWPLYERVVDDLLSRFRKKVRFRWVPREQNVEADALSRKAYNEAGESSRVKKAEKLVSDVRYLGEAIYEVASQSGRGAYQVDMSGPSCTCPDYARHKGSHKCKHILAVELALERTA